MISVENLPGMPVDSVMWPQSTKPLLIITALSCTGVWLMGFGWTCVRVDQRLDQSSSVIEGRVRDAVSRSLSKGGQSLTLTVEYTPDRQPPITRTFDVDSLTYRTARETGKATVTYLPADPRISRVTRFASAPYFILIGMGAIAFASGLFCLAHFLTHRRKIVAAG